MTILKPTPNRHAVGCACGLYRSNLTPAAAVRLERMHTATCVIASRRRLPDRTPIDAELLQPGD